MRVILQKIGYLRALVAFLAMAGLTGGGTVFYSTHQTSMKQQQVLQDVQAKLVAEQAKEIADQKAEKEQVEQDAKDAQAKADALIKQQEQAATQTKTTLQQQAASDPLPKKSDYIHACDSTPASPAAQQDNGSNNAVGGSLQSITISSSELVCAAQGFQEIKAFNDAVAAWNIRHGKANGLPPATTSIHCQDESFSMNNGRDCYIH